MYREILFDLDGTLTDSKEGILKSIVYALDRMRLPPLDEETMIRFIGPPLRDSFMRYCGLSPADADRAIAIYRERYVPVGIFENAVAPGMPELCARLKARGYRLALASSKPEKMCVPICRRFGYAPSMEVITGSGEGGDWIKEDVIRATLRRMGLTEAENSRVLMVGDRCFDVEGAAACGIDCVGVEFFGYAAPGELKAAGAVSVVRTAAELEQFILRH
jgi:phosphoglycolate phosphatase